MDLALRTLPWFPQASEGFARTAEIQALATKAAELLESAELVTPPPQNTTNTSGNMLEPDASLLAKPFRQASAGNASEAQKLLSEALAHAPHSEALLQMRALALLWLRKFEEVLGFCESSLGSSQQNWASEAGPKALDGIRTEENAVRMWRWRVGALAQYHLGKLEEADELAAKVEAIAVEGTVKGREKAVAAEETLEGLRVVIKELLKHKVSTVPVYDGDQNVKLDGKKLVRMQFRIKGRCKKLKERCENLKGRYKNLKDASCLRF
jgi:hypothetical protein